MRKVLIPLTLIGLTLGGTASAATECWQDRTGERSGFNFTDPQCASYMNAQVGKAAFGMPSTEEKTEDMSKPPTESKDEKGMPEKEMKKDDMPSGTERY